MAGKSYVPNVISDHLADVQFLKKLHGWSTMVWLVLIPVSMIWLSEAVWWIVLMSAWANFAGHFSSWQATRVEINQDKDDERFEQLLEEIKNLLADSPRSILRDHCDQTH